MAIVCRGAAGGRRNTSTGSGLGHEVEEAASTALWAHHGARAEARVERQRERKALPGGVARQAPPAGRRRSPAGPAQCNGGAALAPDSLNRCTTTLACVSKTSALLDLAGRALRRRHAGAREGRLPHRRRDLPLLRACRRRELAAKCCAVSAAASASSTVSSAAGVPSACSISSVA